MDYCFFLGRPFDFDLTDEIVSPLAYFPAAGEVFALDLDVDGIYRVVCNANVSVPFRAITNKLIRMVYYF